MFIAHRRAALLAALLLTASCGSASSGASPASPSRPARCSAETGARGAGWTAPMQIAGELPSLIDDSPAWIPGPGPARLRCTITAQGATSACEVIEGPPRGIPALLTSVASWRFTPATCEGAPVAATTELKLPLLPRPVAAPSSAPEAPAQSLPPPESTPAGRGVVLYHPQMTRPVLVSGRQPVYTPEARRAGVEGQVRARCVLDTDGSLHDCAIVWSMPLLDQAVLDALTTQRYTPATSDGKPVKVAYTLRFRFALR